MRDQQLLDFAWEVISAVSDGNWQAQSPAWRDLAIEFRRRHFGPNIAADPGTDTEFGPATSEPMSWGKALEQLELGYDVIRTGPGGARIRNHGIRPAAHGAGRLYLSATTVGFDPTPYWAPCEDDTTATNWVTVNTDLDE